LNRRPLANEIHKSREIKLLKRQCVGISPSPMPLSTKPKCSVELMNLPAMTSLDHERTSKDTSEKQSRAGEVKHAGSATSDNIWLVRSRARRRFVVIIGARGLARRLARRRALRLRAFTGRRRRRVGDSLVVVAADSTGRASRGQGDGVLGGGGRLALVGAPCGSDDLGHRGLVTDVASVGLVRAESDG
jgi:hypothetical protein